MQDISGDAIQADYVNINARRTTIKLQSIHSNSLELRASDVNCDIKDITAASNIKADTANIHIGKQICLDIGIFLWNATKYTEESGQKSSRFQICCFSSGCT